MSDDLHRDEIERARQVFKEEAMELVTELENSLLELESDPDNKELIGRIFRAMHTIKGSGSMFGFDTISKITHEAETMYDMVRNGIIQVTKDLIDLTFPVIDQIHVLLEKPDDSKPEDKAKSDEIISSIKDFLSKAGTGEDSITPPPTLLSPFPQEGGEEDLPLTPPPPSEQGSETKEVSYRIRFKPSRDIFRKGFNLLPLLSELYELGKGKVVAHTDAIPEIGDIEPEACYTYWDVILTTTKGINAIKDVFIFVEDDCELTIDAISEDYELDEVAYKKLGEILVERGDLTDEDLQKVLEKKKRIGEILIEEGLVESTKVASALAEQRETKEVLLSRLKMGELASIRVPSERLDRLVNLVGELVTVQARLSQTVTHKDDPDLLIISEEIERLTDELRDSTMTIRLLPISTIFSKFRRLVRDLSRELDKEVRLVTEGGETELDKTVIERLTDPLVHLIRNCIDHGIESPESRESTGKPRQGIIRLSALHAGHEVLIQIIDDGAGLDIETIRSKAVEKGLISDNDQLSERESHSLIFSPGFSTARDVTDVSGRGVGLDVVKKVIESLRGSLEIYSQEGVGSTITLKLPLTLMIIEGLLVKLGGDTFVIPLSNVEECIELTKDDVEKSHGRNITAVRGEIIPYIRLREMFSISGNPPEIEQIVVTRSNEDRVGFAVDSVIGEHQTVIKSLGSFYRDIEGISGATILGDGRVALILDGNGLAKMAEVYEQGIPEKTSKTIEGNQR
jgi:two-component system chemotaxis sensor kinase CheA